MFTKNAVWLVLAMAVVAWGGVASAELVDITNLIPAGQTDVLGLSTTITVSSASYDERGPVSEPAFSDILVDGKADNNAAPYVTGFYFGVSDPDQRVAFTGFNSGFTTVRIFTAPADTNRLVGDITLKSSTTLLAPADAIDASKYETTLGTFPVAGRSYVDLFGAPAGYRSYFDVAVSAPSGTQSLFIDCGNGGSNGDRLMEVEALTSVPEPSTIVLLGAGLVGLLAYAWRKRR